MPFKGTKGENLQIAFDGTEYNSYLHQVRAEPDDGEDGDFLTNPVIVCATDGIDQSLLELVLERGLRDGDSRCHFAHQITHAGDPFENDCGQFFAFARPAGAEIIERILG